MKDLTKLYSNLYILLSSRKEVVLGVWVMREDLAFEGMPTKTPLSLDDESTYEILKSLDQDAAVAKQEDWFYCTGHKRPEKCESGQYHWFAGKYCSLYGTENPQHREMALTETYN